MNLYLDYLQNMSIVVGWWGSIVIMIGLLAAFFRSFMRQWTVDKNRYSPDGPAYKLVKDENGDTKSLMESKARRIFFRITAPIVLIFGIPLLVGWAWYLKGVPYALGAFMLSYSTAILCAFGFLVLVSLGLYMIVVPFDADEKLSRFRMTMLYGFGIPIEFFAWPALILALNSVP